MFVQGKRPALTVSRSRLASFRAAMRAAGYSPHTGPRYQRHGEIGAWSRDLPGGRHVHVQEVDRGKVVAVFAHTEPSTGNFLAHAISALTDRANYSAGARSLRADLRRARFLR